MNNLMNADPAVQKTVAIAAVVTGAVAITAIATTLGRKWANDRLESMERASAVTLNNLKN